jgi:leader peptidase (prepilin peptidase)/N-methyltransferase
VGHAAAALWGALWGSFLNVCIARVPEGEQVVRGRSRCRSCGATIRWYDNVPLASWLALRGACRACGARISPRYLVVEALSTALSVALWHVIVGDGGVTPRLVSVWLAHYAFAAVLVVISFIDLATYRIPNPITYPGIPLFAAASLLRAPPRWWHGPLGALAGYAVLRLVSDLYFRITGREGMGYGDAKLLALTGGFLGWPSLVPTVFLGSVVGSIAGVALTLTRRRRGEQASIRLTRVPFGPFLAAGALSYLFFGDPLAAILAAPGW